MVPTVGGTSGDVYLLNRRFRFDANLAISSVKHRHKRIPSPPRRLLRDQKTLTSVMSETIFERLPTP
jgi:hypothetical protein